MRSWPRFLVLPLGLLAIVSAEPAQAQVLSRHNKLIDLAGVRPVDRITGPIDDRVRIVRAGNVHPLARREFDLGPAPLDTRMDRLVLSLLPDAAQQEALDALLEAQQDAHSPQYHKWLSPEEFGRIFGASERDLGRVAGWLESHGFQVEPVSGSRRLIVFSGTAGQVQSAFHTEIHLYNVRGKVHYANATDPEIPQALANLAGGVVSLHNFQSHPLHTAFQPAAAAAPEFSAGTVHYLAPADFATIYDSAGLYSQSIDGRGQSIAVAGRSDFNLPDVQTFQEEFGLPVNRPTVIVNGIDPGIVSRDELGEATLDVEWAGAVAPKASIQFVVSASTNATDGVGLSAQYIVEHNLAPVVTLSFGLCEAELGTSGNQFWNSLWQQAAAQGMTVLVASGDSGAAGCDSPSAASAIGGKAVNGLCSSPYSTCVGGTEPADRSTPNSYWSARSDQAFGSALGYIPESVWNESGTVDGGAELWAGGGGASQVYSKPSWQSGPGVPADGRRDVPDVALTSAAHDGYLVVMNGLLYVCGGTSAATPSFAGLIALISQKTQARQGNINPALYALAAKQASGGAGVFHDVTAGSNSVPGVEGIAAGIGYDAASGLGSVDANVLADHWTDSLEEGPLQLSANPASLSLAQGNSTVATISTSVRGGFNSTIALAVSGLPSGLTASFMPSSVTPGNGSVVLNLSASAALAQGSYSLTITAAGGGLSQTATLAVTISANCTYSVTPAGLDVAFTGGGFTGTVTTQPGCQWSGASNVPWITVTGGTSGAGNGTVQYTVAPNAVSAARSGTLTIAGQTVNVTQGGAAGAFSLDASSATLPSPGGTRSVAVASSSSTAAWKAQSNASWITIVNGASGTGSGTVVYTVATNTSGAARWGTMTIAGLTFTVNQSGPAAECAYQVSIGAVTATSQGYQGSVSVATSAGCPWSTASNAPWLTVTSGSSGTGNGSVSFVAGFNTTSSTRTGVLSVAGYAIDITESASQ